MHVSFFQFVQGLRRVSVGVSHVFVKSLKFLSLGLGFDCDILCYGVDIGHDICDGIDVVLPLGDHVFHEVHFPRYFQLLLLLELVLPVIDVLLLCYSVDHVIVLLAGFGLNETSLERLDGQIRVHLLFLLDLDADLFELLHETFMGLGERRELVSLLLDHVLCYLQVPEVRDLSAARFHYGCGVL